MVLMDMEMNESRKREQNGTERNRGKFEQVEG
jgi:hypothetical protein